MAPPCFWPMNRTALTQWLARQWTCSFQDTRMADRFDFRCLVPFTCRLWHAKYPYGLNQVGRLKLYTNRGLGTIVLPVRFGCPPEITLLTLRSELA